MARLHLTYQHRDRDVVVALRQKLEGKGHRVDGDFELLVPGQEWRKTLRESFLASDYLLVVLTANTIAPNTSTISSQWVAADIGAGALVWKGRPAPLHRQHPVSRPDRGHLHDLDSGFECA